MLRLGTICWQMVVKNIRSKEDRTYTDPENPTRYWNHSGSSCPCPSFSEKVKAVWINNCKGAFTSLLEDEKRKYCLLVKQRNLRQRLVVTENKSIMFYSNTEQCRQKADSKGLHGMCLMPS